jgi:hypothetical protein
MRKSGGKSRDTEAWVRSVMEKAITSKYQPTSKTLNKEIHVGMRLASLYGSNTSSKIVKKRAKKNSGALQTSTIEFPQCQKKKGTEGDVRHGHVHG